jgi:hypothetical protein
MKYRIMEETQGNRRTFFVQQQKFFLWWDMTFYDAQFDCTFRYEFDTPPEAFCFITNELGEVTNRVVQEVYK